MANIKSTREVAEFCGVETWRIRRLFEDGTLPEPGRFAGKRAITPDLIPAIIDALRVRGWLPEAVYIDAAAQERQGVAHAE